MTTSTKFSSKNVLRLSAVLVAGALIAAPFLSHEAGQRAEARAARVAETQAIAESTGLQREQLAVYESIALARAESDAVLALDSATAVLASVQEKVDASSLSSSVAALGEYKTLDADTMRDLTKKTLTETDVAAAAGAEADRIAAEQAAAAAEAARAAEAAEAAVEAARVANTPDGARNTARNMLSGYGWGSDQFSCLDRLWTKESHWTVNAQNNAFSRSNPHLPEYQAYGIVQAGPGAKMASHGADWKTNAATQIAWGLSYITARYGTPCGAWNHSVANGYY